MIIGRSNWEKKKDKKAPICLYEPLKARGITHFLTDGRDCPEELKLKLMREQLEALARTGPANGT